MGSWSVLCGHCKSEMGKCQAAREVEHENAHIRNRHDCVNGLHLG